VRAGVCTQPGSPTVTSTLDFGEHTAGRARAADRIEVGDQAVLSATGAAE
jgi:hypothetical protein